MEKKMDKVGRITIPKEIRYMMGLEPGCMVKIEVIENKIVIEKA